MKNAYTILSHLTKQPQFKYLKRHECYQKYIKLLGDKYQKAIAFIYIKNETLYVAVTHPGFKMELNYNKDLLKEILIQFISIEKNCSMLQADKVVIFHSKYHKLPDQRDEEKTVPYYSELASSDFKVETEDQELKRQFEQIKAQIEKNR